VDRLPLAARKPVRTQARQAPVLGKQQVVLAEGKQVPVEGKE